MADEFLEGADGIGDDEILEEDLPEVNSSRKLLKAVGGRVGRTRGKGSDAPAKEPAKLVPSELYDASVYGMPGKEQIGLEDLVTGTLKSSTAYGDLKKRLAKLQSGPGAVPRPKDPTVVERETRVSGYQVANEEVGTWEDEVKRNREATQLHFPLEGKVPSTMSTSAMATRSGPAVTELEKKVREVLKESGVDDAAIARYEKALKERGEETGAAERKDRRTKEKQQGGAHLGMRAYYEHLKAARRGKIKSKSFRKIERQRKAELREIALQELREADPEAAKELEDRKEKKRIEERATLRHSGASKWMHKVKSKGLAKAPEMRRVIADNARIAKELAHKSQAADGEGGEDASEAEEVAGGEKDEVTVPQTEDDGVGRFTGRKDDYETAEAEEAEREKAAEEREEFEPVEVPSTKDYPAAPAPKFSGTGAVIKSAGITSGHKVRVEGNIAVAGIKGGAGPAEGKAERSDDLMFQEESFVSLDTPKKSPKRATKKDSTDSAAAPKAKAMSAAATTTDSSNPWLSVPAGKTTQQQKGKGSPAAQDDDEAEEKVDGGQAEGDDDDEEESDAEGMGALDLMNPEDSVQKKLIQEAFATDDAGMDRDFTAEKEAAVAEQAGIKKGGDPTSAATAAGRLPGWGQWIGDGVVETDRAKARREREEKNAEAATAKKLEETRRIRRDADLKHVIINEKVDTKMAQFKLQSAPNGGTVEHYERVIAQPVGKEWQTSTMHRRMVTPRIEIAPGSIVQPLKVHRVISKRQQEKEKEKEKGVFAEDDAPKPKRQKKPTKKPQATKK